MKFQIKIIPVLLIILLSSCATYNMQSTGNSKVNVPSSKQIKHSFYLIGDAGNSSLGEASKSLQAFKKELNKASANSTALFLGDNIYPRGLPKKNDQERAFAEHQLNVQTDAVSNFKGETIFIPGNHDWYSDGVKGLKRQEKYIEDILGKNSFSPKNGCPIDKINISDDIVLITIDTEWYLTNWDKHPTINDNCHIKTRINFFDEFASLIKKSRGKTTIIALHHPIFTNGPHGGQYDVKSHLKPLPVLGTLKNLIRKTSGISPADVQNKKYSKLKKRIVTLSQENDKVIFVSGHEHSLQYIVQDNLPQIVSGSGAKITGTRNTGGGQFSYSTSGYAKLDVYVDGSSHVSFYSADENKVVFEKQVHKPNSKKINTTYPSNFPKEKTASIYTDEETDKSKFHEFLWGDRYRKEYSTKVTVPTVNLDTLFGGVTVGRRGGGTQSKSLRLLTKDGKKQYIMRAMRKQGTQYLQASFFKDLYLDGQFDDTGAEDIILDVFTGSHPYAPFVIGDLSDAVGVYHLNPKLYYIPKQKALGDFNEQFGDELYMIEEHASDGHGDLDSFGNSNKVISTADVIEKLHKDEDLIMDEDAYIRARLFDMLIGDWDRHQDQWRWLEFKENGKKVYRPLPRDRDQAFSIMSDGALLTSAVTLMPTARLLRKYNDDLVDVKGINVEPYPLDMEFIQESDKAVWDKQVKIIQNGITDAVIDKAFLNFPAEVRGNTISEIKRKLQGRRSNLQAISDRYFNLLNKFSVIKGTNKKDYFTITANKNGSVNVTANRIKDGEKREQFHQRNYDPAETKEIWIYGLDDDDVFEVTGKSNKIKIRLIGGQNNDIYKVAHGKKIVIYDYKSKPNEISEAKKAKIKLTDDYETNVYDYKKLKSNINQLIPTIGSNPDDGFRIGISNTYTTYGFERNPFTSQHHISAAYYFANQGYDLKYKGEFSNIFQDWNFSVEGKYTSPSFAENFFGIGNETTYDSDEVDLDFNRVRIREWNAAISLIYRGDNGAAFHVKPLIESFEVENTEDRFVNDITKVDPNSTFFEKQTYAGGELAYEYMNKDNLAFPTLGIDFKITGGYKTNIDDSSADNNFGYLIPELAFDHKLNQKGSLVLATKVAGEVVFGDDFEFYHGAQIGGVNGLRGFRNERFVGKQSYYQNTDIRVALSKVRTSLLPLLFGISAGYDYGRVWVEDDNSNVWNTSYGGSLWLSGVDAISANIGYYNSDDGSRLVFVLGFAF